MRLAQAWPGHLRGTGISHRPRPACDQILRRGHRPGPARAAPGPSLSRTSVSKISWDFWRSRRRFWRPPSEDFGGLRFEFLKPNQELFCDPKNKNILDPGGKISGDPGRPRQRFWRRRICNLTDFGVQNGPIFRPKSDPFLVPKLDRFWVQKWTNFGTKIGSILGPKLDQISTDFWTNFRPKSGAEGDLAWSAQCNRQRCPDRRVGPRTPNFTF